MTDTAELPLDEEPETKLTTPALENLLRAKYPRDRYALFFDVPDAVGTSQHRRIDALTFGIWSSVGRDIQGFELKVSRSDWLRELKQVNKADPFIAICDRFWLVTADSTIAKLEEVPACWGWMSATNTGLRVQRPATKLPGVGEAIPRNFLIGVLRRMQDDMIGSPEIAAHIAGRVAELTERHADVVKNMERRSNTKLEALQNKVDEFRKQSGIDLADWRMGNVGGLVKQLQTLGYSDGLNHVPEILERQENVLRIALENVAKVRAELAQLSAP